MKSTHALPVRRGCRCVGLSPGAFYRRPMDWVKRDAEVIEALNELVEMHPRWGFWKYVERLRVLGHGWNHKRIYRVYCGLGLPLNFYQLSNGRLHHKAAIFKV